MQSLHPKIAEFERKYKGNEEDATSNQGYSSYEHDEAEIAGHRDRCFSKYFSLNDRELLDPNVVNSFREFRKMSARYQKVVDAWEARRKIHLEQNPVVINLTGNNSSGSRSRRSSRSRERN